MGNTKIFLAAGSLAAVALFLVSDYGLFLMTLAVGQAGFDISEDGFLGRAMYRKHDRLPVRPPTPIPEIDATDLSKETLEKASRDWTMPVVIRGLLKDTNAFKKWDFDYLATEYGAETFIMRQKFSDNTMAVARRNFTNFYDKYNNGKDVTILASSSVFVRRPELVEDIITPHDKLYMDRDDVALTQFFITPGSSTRLHCEFGANVFKQILGVKEWVFVAPEHHYLMGPRPLVSGTTVTPAAAIFHHGEAYFEEYMQRVPRYSVTVHAGDVLVNAPWWWHGVRSVGDGPQISVAERIRTVGRSFRLSPVLTSLGVATVLFNHFSGKTDQMLNPTPEMMENNIFGHIASEFDKRFGPLMKPENLASF